MGDISSYLKKSALPAIETIATAELVKFPDPRTEDHQASHKNQSQKDKNKQIANLEQDLLLIEAQRNLVNALKLAYRGKNKELHVSRDYGQGLKFENTELKLLNNEIVIRETLNQLANNQDQKLEELKSEKIKIERKIKGRKKSDIRYIFYTLYSYSLWFLAIFTGGRLGGLRGVRTSETHHTVVNSGAPNLSHDGSVQIPGLVDPYVKQGFAWGGVSYFFELIFDLADIAVGTVYPWPRSFVQCWKQFLTELHRPGRLGRMRNAAMWLSINLIGIVLTNGWWVLPLLAVPVANAILNLIGFTYDVLEAIWQGVKELREYFKQCSDIDFEIEYTQEKIQQLEETKKLNPDNLKMQQEIEHQIKQLKAQITALHTFRDSITLKIQECYQRTFHSVGIALIILLGMIGIYLPSLINPAALPVSLLVTFIAGTLLSFSGSVFGGIGRRIFNWCKLHWLSELIVVKPITLIASPFVWLGGKITQQAWFKTVAKLLWNLGALILTPSLSEKEKTLRGQQDIFIFSKKAVLKPLSEPPKLTELDIAVSNVSQEQDAFLRPACNPGIEEEQQAQTKQVATHSNTDKAAKKPVTYTEAKEIDLHKCNNQAHINRLLNEGSTFITYHVEEVIAQDRKQHLDIIYASESNTTPPSESNAEPPSPRTPQTPDTEETNPSVLLTKVAEKLNCTTQNDPSSMKPNEDDTTPTTSPTGSPQTSSGLLPKISGNSSPKESSTPSTENLSTQPYLKL